MNNEHNIITQRVFSPQFADPPVFTGLLQLSNVFPRTTTLALTHPPTTPLENRLAEIKDSIAHFDDLPNDVLDHILEFLPLKCIPTLQSVCRRFYQRVEHLISEKYKFKNIIQRFDLSLFHPIFNDCSNTKKRLLITKLDDFFKRHPFESFRSPPTQRLFHIQHLVNQERPRLREQPIALALVLLQTLREKIFTDDSSFYGTHDKDVDQDTLIQLIHYFQTHIDNFNSICSPRQNRNLIPPLLLMAFFLMHTFSSLKRQSSQEFPEKCC